MPTPQRKGWSGKMTHGRPAGPKQYATELGYADDELRAVTVEPDGSLVVVTEDKQGRVNRHVHGPDEAPEDAQ